MDNRKFMQVAVKAVTDYHNATNDAACDKITEDDVFIVWACKTIGNNKAMLATDVRDGMYYEFTWNGAKNEGYLDAYKKCANVVVTAD